MWWRGATDDHGQTRTDTDREGDGMRQGYKYNDISAIIGTNE